MGTADESFETQVLVSLAEIKGDVKRVSDALNKQDDKSENHEKRIRRLELLGTGVVIAAGGLGAWAGDIIQAIGG